MKAYALSAVLVAATLTATSAAAGPISSACLRSDRSMASRSLCSCIQRVADVSLSRSDQRLAAKFFTKPDMAQKVRMSKSDYHNAFWARYKAFGARAAQSCS